MTAASAFVNRDSFHTAPDLHSGKLFRRLKEGGGVKRRESKESQNKAPQEAIITMRKKRINSNL